jgi:hypothetical protein
LQLWLVVDTSIENVFNMESALPSSDKRGESSKRNPKISVSYIAKYPQCTHTSQVASKARIGCQVGDELPLLQGKPGARSEGEQQHDAPREEKPDLHVAA